MARADLHNALVIDHEIYEASQVDPTLLDPIVRTTGGLPGPAQPFTVVRAYQGPQGSYGEYFTITDQTGREVARSHVRRIALRGEMFEDDFSTTLRGVQLHDGGEHTAAFYVNDRQVGAIPVFVESAQGGDPRVAAEETFAKALQKGAVLWLTVPQRAARRKRQPTEHTQAVWFVFDKGKVYVLSGPTEQEVPDLAQAEQVVVTARSKDLRSAVSRVEATVRVVDKADEEWERIARTGLGKRLNLRDGDGALERWKEHCLLVELTPRFRTAEANGAAAGSAPATSVTPAQSADPAPAAKKAEEDIHVEAQVDQEVFDRLIAEGKSERVARAKAKAAYVRREKARIREEQAGDSASANRDAREDANAGGG
ncbi:hypothetical protein BH23ACT8_BH23ACT8_06080 [soil metagenome]